MSPYTSGETDEYDEKAQVRVRMHGPDRAALDRIGESHPEWSNRSDVIRGLIREADAGTTVDEDGGATDGPETWTPDEAKHAAVYDSVLNAVASDHVLHEDELGSIATTVTNDSAIGITPDSDAVRRYLRELEADGFARRTFSVPSVTALEGTTKWHIKPATAVPEEWRHHPDRVTERQERRQRERRKLLGSPVPESEGATTVDTAAWLAEEREAAADGGEVDS